ncbi:MAG: DUF1223 domain-containing protein [Hyphomicrobiaceae bacterium]|nr:DUF1223 domain-containing protein [Hyphomicrobiaceae bacterium]
MHAGRYVWLFPMVASLLLATAAVAQTRPTVLELFTSQGCSSCPAADRLFKSYIGRRDVIALSFNVDYWDYLGWKDTLAKSSFSERQRFYARQRGDGAVYTPQMVVNGVDHAIGSRQAEIDAAIRRSWKKLKTAKLRLDTTTTEDRFVIAIKHEGEPLKRPATVWLASVEPKVTVRIQRGENRGSTATYYNVVREIAAVGMWPGHATTIEVRQRSYLKKPGMRCVVLVQADSGAILAASWLNQAR